MSDVNAKYILSHDPPDDHRQWMVGSDQSVSEPITRDEFYKARYPYDGRPLSESTDLLNDLFQSSSCFGGGLYRGGVLKKTPSHYDGDHPLGPNALINLCEEGFGTAIYLPMGQFYSPDTQFSADARLTFDSKTGDVQVRCLNRITGELNALRYTHKAVESTNNTRDLMDIVYQSLQPSGRPVYAHCQGGRHRSGLMAVYSLIQYCGLSNTPYRDDNGKIMTDPYGGILSPASVYWYNNTGGQNDDPRNPASDGYDPNDKEWMKDFTDTMNSIKDFIPFPDLQISQTIRDAVCPTSDPLDPNNPEHFQDRR